MQTSTDLVRPASTEPAGVEAQHRTALYHDFVAEIVRVDAVAEAMLQQKLRPESTLKGFLAKTGIHEAENEEVTSKEAYTRVLADFEYLLKEVIAVKEAAEEKKNYLVSTLMDDYIASFSKNIWMLRQALK